MRPSIAAALSTLGEVHNASEVLLRPADSAKFAEAYLNGELRVDRVIARPDGALLLIVEAGPTRLPMNERSQFAFVGAVEPSAWAWADPTKRQPAPLARVNLDARDIHCLTQGGEIHRGATVGTTPTGLVALQVARVKSAITINLAGSADPEKVIAAWSAAAERMNATGRTSILPKRAKFTPKDGDALESFTPDGLDALPVGAKFVRSDAMPVTKQPSGSWRDEGSACAVVSAYNSQSVLTSFWKRTLVLPVTTRTPKVGDRLDSFTAAELDGLPVGARFELPGYFPIERTATGWRKWDLDPYTISVGGHDHGERLLVLPKPAPAPKVGDRWGDLDAGQRQTLPVGTVLGNVGPLGPLWLAASGWVDVNGNALAASLNLNPDRTIAFLPVSK